MCETCELTGRCQGNAQTTAPCSAPFEELQSSQKVPDAPLVGDALFALFRGPHLPAGHLSREKGCKSESSERTAANAAPAPQSKSNHRRLTSEARWLIWSSVSGSTSPPSQARHRLLPRSSMEVTTLSVVPRVTLLVIRHGKGSVIRQSSVAGCAIQISSFCLHAATARKQGLRRKKGRMKGMMMP